MHTNYILIIMLTFASVSVNVSVRNVLWEACEEKRVRLLLAKEEEGLVVVSSG